jgi:hypothetical protein
LTIEPRPGAIIRNVKPHLRATLVALLVVLALSAPAWAATPTESYKIAPTRACLTQRGARLLAAKYSTPRHQIQWILATAAGFPVTIEMEFSDNPTQAAAQERRLRHAYRIEKLSGTWIRDHLFRRENVVVHPNITAARVTASRVATIVGCLRR